MMGEDGPRRKKRPALLIKKNEDEETKIGKRGEKKEEAEIIETGFFLV